MKWLPLLVAALATVGCGSTATDSPSKIEPKAQPAVGSVDVDTATLKASYESTKKSFETDRGDEAKKKYVDATVAYATNVMAGDGKPSEKYPLALDLYDEAIAVDPDNEEAKTNRQLILDIYKSLGKEPPKK